MRVAFLLGDLQPSAAAEAVVAHAAALRGGTDVDARIVLTREQEHRHHAYPGLDAVPVETYNNARSAAWDIAVCTGGATAPPALGLAARRHACVLVDADHADGVYATALPLRFLATSPEQAALLEDLQEAEAGTVAVVSDDAAALAGALRAILDAAPPTASAHRIASDLATAAAEAEVQRFHADRALAHATASGAATPGTTRLTPHRIAGALKRRAKARLGP